jgi:hypothetical protein
MELTYVTIVVLASMIFVLSGMVGYLYWQQTRMLQHLQSLASVVASQIHQVEAEPEPEPEPEAEAEVAPEAEATPDDASVTPEEDDRMSVEHVEGPPPTKHDEPPVDVDDIQSNTVAQLRDLLTRKGIPFGKRDAKSVLIQLLKATA